MPRPPSPEDPGDPKARAVKLLARREHSARELKRKLEARGFSKDAAAEAVGHLAQAGWQDDARYAEMLVRSRVGQGYGPLRIEAELRMAGLAASDIRKALDASGADWRTLAARAQARHFVLLPRTSADRAKQYRYLQGRGFDSAQIQAALKGDLAED